MPKGSVPDRERDLLECREVGHLVTIGPGGRPQVNSVWFLADAPSVSRSITPDTVKDRHLRALPYVALSIADPAPPARSRERRGMVVTFERFATFAWVNQLARKDTGVDVTGGQDGEVRSKVTIRIDAWTAQG